MARRVLILLCTCLLALFMAGCGQTYELQSITVSPTSVNIYGVGGQQAFTVTAQYSNYKTANRTSQATYQLQLPSDVTAGTTGFDLSALEVNQSGVVTVIGGACTWTVSTTGSGTTETYAYGTYPFQLIVTYKEGSITTTATVPVSVNSLIGCYDGINTKL